MYANHHQPILKEGEGIEAPSFEELAAVATGRLLGATGLTMVFGPITTGGTNNQVHNFAVMNAAIRGLARKGCRVFDQLPYELGLRKLLHQWEAEGNTGYCRPILDVFYTRVFSTGSIARGRFVPGWRSSIGATWEREQLIVRGCVVDELTLEEIEEFLAAECAPKLVKTIMAELASGVRAAGGA